MKDSGMEDTKHQYSPVTKKMAKDGIKRAKEQSDKVVKEGLTALRKDRKKPPLSDCAIPCSECPASIGDAAKRMTGPEKLEVEHMRMLAMISSGTPYYVDANAKMAMKGTGKMSGEMINGFDILKEYRGKNIVIIVIDEGMFEQLRRLK